MNDPSFGLLLVPGTNLKRLPSRVTTENEQLKRFNNKHENTYACKIIGSTEQKLKVIEQIERDYNINIKNGINKNSNEIKFSTDFY